MIISSNCNTENSMLSFGCLGHCDTICFTGIEAETLTLEAEIRGCKFCPELVKNDEGDFCLNTECLPLGTFSFCLKDENDTNATYEFEGSEYEYFYLEIKPKING